MTLSDALAETADPVGRLAYVRALADQMPQFMRLAHAHKAQLANEGRDRAALVLLFPIKRLGPVRQGALADLMHTDPSTVSRHVASLVDQGLVQRVADESDGRASRLVITDAGHQALENLCAERATLVRQATAAWDPADLAVFTRLFARLIDDMDAALTGRSLPAQSASVAPSPRRTR